MYISLASGLSRYCRSSTQYSSSQQTCYQSFLHLIPFDLQKHDLDDLPVRTDHLHSIVGLRMTGAGKLAKCVHTAAIMLHRNIHLDPWLIGHRGLGGFLNARYKAAS